MSESKGGSRVDLARRLMQLAADSLDREVPTHLVIERMAKALEWARAGAPPKPKPAPKVKTPEQIARDEERKRSASLAEEQAANDLWTYWSSETRLSWSLTPERKQRLVAALRAHGIAKLEASIRGMVLTPWAMGTAKDSDGTKHCDVAIFVKHVDVFAEKGGFRPGAAAAPEGMRQKLAKLEKEKADALRDGETERYEQLRSEIARLSAGGGS